MRCYQAFIQSYLLQFQSQGLTIRPSRAASPVVDCSTPIRKKVGDEIGKISTLECESFWSFKAHNAVRLVPSPPHFYRAWVKVSLRWLLIRVHWIKEMILQNDISTHENKQGYLLSGENVGPAKQILWRHSATRGSTAREGELENHPKSNVHLQNPASKACQTCSRMGGGGFFRTGNSRWRRRKHDVDPAWGLLRGLRRCSSRSAKDWGPHRPQTFHIANLQKDHNHSARPKKKSRSWR